MTTPADWRPDELPTALISRFARGMNRQLDVRLEYLGISVAQLPVLAALKRQESMTQRELAELAGVEQPSMAQLLARMERDGMVRRTPSLADKRSSVITLTSKAMDCLEPGRALLLQADRDACAALTTDERQMLIGLLNKLRIPESDAL